LAAPIEVCSYFRCAEKKRVTVFQKKKSGLFSSRSSNANELLIPIKMQNFVRVDFAHVKQAGENKKGVGRKPGLVTGLRQRRSFI
jgi:hypothetical protein